MIDSLFQDRFSTDFNSVFGVERGHFSFGQSKDRTDIPQHQKNRSNARSMGRTTYMHTKQCKGCGGLVRKVKNNECVGCL